MKTFLEDIESPLSMVERDWIRLPITLLLFIVIVLPICIILGAISGIWESLVMGYNDFLVDCWKGPK